MDIGGYGSRIALAALACPGRQKLFSRRDASEFYKTIRPEKTRAWGMPGVDAPAASCVVKNTRVSHHRYTGNHPAFPHAMVLRLIPCSPRRRIRFCHRHPRIKVLSARSGRLASANLTPATGARTTRRTQKRRSSCTPLTAHEVHFALRLLFARLTLLRPPHPAPRS